MRARYSLILRALASEGVMKVNPSWAWSPLFSDPLDFHLQFLNRLLGGNGKG